jgi:hypothetical protein
MNAILRGRRIDRWTVITAFLAAVVFSILPAAPAAAGEVHFDPDSPAGKEYALPLPQARNEAMGKEGIEDEPPSQAPLFGVGVGGSGGGDGGESQGNGSPRSSGQNQGNPGSDKANPGGNPQSGAAKANPTAQDTSYGLGTAIALVGAILLIALALGFALRALAKVAGGRSLGRA